MCLLYQDGFADDWRAQSYPWAGNSEEVAITPMRYCGVPGALVYRPDQSLVVLFAIDSHSDYLNPTTWTGKTGFHFANRRSAPQFRVGGGRLAAGIRYEMPLQLFFSDAGEFAGAITGIMQAWIELNDYRVDDTLKVRTPQEAFGSPSKAAGRCRAGSRASATSITRARRSFTWGTTRTSPTTSIGSTKSPANSLWRERAFEQIDFAHQGAAAQRRVPYVLVFADMARPIGRRLLQLGLGP